MQRWLSRSDAYIGSFISLICRGQCLEMPEASSPTVLDVFSGALKAEFRPLRRTSDALFEGFLCAAGEPAAPHSIKIEYLRENQQNK